MRPTPWLDDDGTALAEPLPFDGGVGPWLPLSAVSLDRGASEDEPVTRLTVGATPEVDPLVEVVSLAVPVDVVGLAVAVDVVILVAAVVVVLGAVDVVILVDTVVEVDVDGALVEVAPTSADASFGVETETDVAGAVDAVVSTDATLGAETDTEEVLALVELATSTEVALTEIGSGEDAETDTPEIPSARASTGAANMRASAATHTYALFLLISRLFLPITPTTANSQAIRLTCLS
jgi:hypothetical protein